MGPVRTAAGQHKDVERPTSGRGGDRDHGSWSGSSGREGFAYFEIEDRDRVIAERRVDELRDRHAADGIAPPWSRGFACGDQGGDD
jgi:hypothetical protein